MINRARGDGYKTSNGFKHLIPPYEISQQVYLTIEELKSLYALKNLTVSLEIIRDTFLIACFTGLRLSDMLTLESFHVVGNEIIKIVRKTGKSITIPLHPITKEILNKYNNSLPKIKTSQYHNRGIKKLCQMAGINQLVTREFIQGGKIVSETTKKYNLVTSHTARRTAITNLYLSGEVDLLTLQKFSGHSNIDNLLLYIKSSDNEHLKILTNASYFQDKSKFSFNLRQFNLKNYKRNLQNLKKHRFREIS